MTNINKPESPNSSNQDHGFDGITFEVEEEEHTHEGQKVKRRGIYLWPNLITTSALLSGFYSIIASMNGDFTQAVYAIFLAALFDGLDGRVLVQLVHKVLLVNNSIHFQICWHLVLPLRF